MLFNLFRRSTKSAMTSRDLELLLRRTSTASSGIDVTPDVALRHGPVFACIRVLAESVGAMPVHLIEETDQGRKRKAKKHPLYRLIHRRPNQFQTTQEWLEMVIAHQCLEGNHYSYINRAGGAHARELLPLNPTAVTPKLTADGGEVVYQVKFANGTEDVLGQRDVLHLKTFTIDGVRGLSPIRYAKDTIGLNLAVEQHAAKLFASGAQPNGILSTDQVLTDDSYRRIKESWNERHQGLENAHKVAILEGGLRWAATGLSAEDAQMLESRRFGLTEVARLFRVPPAMIADLSGATFSNSEQQMTSFINLALMPYLKRIEDRISFQLLDENEQERFSAKFNAAALLRGDMAARASFYTQMLNASAYSPNEIRAYEDLDPREGGDIYLVPLNMAIQGSDGEFLPPPNQAPALPPGNEEPEQDAELVEDTNTTEEAPASDTEEAA